MSNIYLNEPPTNGKVLLTTTFGDLDIELWSKECPKACRNFVQLCMEHYYDGSAFFRIIKGFMAQCGDPTGTGTGGESIYGAAFKDEFHQRLRFTRPGLVAMANAGPNDNNSQFFFTLGPTPDLQNKHTIFGKVSGDTKYNMLKLNEIQIGANDRPIQLPKIKKAIILSNPFTDIIPRISLEQRQKDETNKKVTTSPKKLLASKRLNLLSFGQEAMEEEITFNQQQQSAKGVRMGKSSHDLTDDPTLLKESLNPTYVDGMEQDLVNDNLNFKPKHKTELNMVDKNKLETIKNKIVSIQNLNPDNEKLKRLGVEYLEEEAEDEESDADEEDQSHQNIDEAVENTGEDMNAISEIMEAMKHKKLANGEEAPYSSEFSREALYEYVDSTRAYKEKKKSMPKKGAKREQQTLNLLTTFRQKLEVEKQKCLSNKLPRPKKPSFRQGPKKLKDAMKKRENLTEIYPELKMWEGDEEPVQVDQDAVQDDDKIFNILTHHFVCSDEGSSSGEDVYGPKKSAIDKSNRKDKPVKVKPLGEGEAEPSSTSDDTADEDWFLLKKTTKDACAIMPHEFYSINDPRNPINVRRREGEKMDFTSSYNRKMDRDKDNYKPNFKPAQALKYNPKSSKFVSSKKS